MHGAEILTQDVELEKDCTRCDGHLALVGRCPECGGIGTILTPLGQRIMEMVERRFGDMFEQACDDRDVLYRL
jgi:DnaJ-class molecular chaperone